MQDTEHFVLVVVEVGLGLQSFSLYSANIMEQDGLLHLLFAAQVKVLVHVVEAYLPFAVGIQGYSYSVRGSFFVRIVSLGLLDHVSIFLLSCHCLCEENFS